MKKTITLAFALLLIITISKAQTITWGTAMNIATSASGNEHPRVVTDRSGNPMVVWGHSNRVLFSRWNGSSFSAPVMLNPMWMTVAEASWMGPDIAAHGDTVYVVFKQSPEAADTCHVFCTHSFNGGVSFSAPVQVDNIADSISRFPTVTTDAIGNPIIGFMKFNSSFAAARWVVAKSTNFGTSFSIDHKASGWSSMTSTVCDCCPGSITCQGNTVAMVYRDNNSNYRDAWAGISTNAGSSFAGGMGIDQQNWMLMSCPASGPDAVVIGDTLYSVFMNGASGTDRTFYNKSSLSGMTGSAGMLTTGNITGLSQQNYPRIATDGAATAIVWTQYVNGGYELLILFTNTIANGFPAMYGMVDMGDITNTDVAISNGKIVVVWEDDNAGTVKYRMGTFASVTGIKENREQDLFSVYPNPASDNLNIQLSSSFQKEKITVSVSTVLGNEVYSSEMDPANNIISLTTKNFADGIYFIKVQSGTTMGTKKIIINTK